MTESPTQPAVTLVDISDPTAASQGIESLENIDAIQLQQTPLNVRRIVARLGSTSIVYHSTNVRLRTRTRLGDGLLAFVTFGPRTTGTVDGVEVGHDMLLSASPEAEAMFVTHAGWETIDLLVPQERLHAHLANRGAVSDRRLPAGIDVQHVSTAQADGLFEFGKRLLSSALLDPTLFDPASSVQATAEEALLERLSSTLGATVRTEPTREERTRAAHCRVVRQVEDFVMAHGGDRLYVSDLCRVASVSERTLEYACQDVLGLTPMAYLTRLRLHRVRQALLAKGAASTTVTSEALNWGFRHFGELARAYTQCFGERPSETLHLRH